MHTIQHIKALFSMTATYYQQTIDDDVLSMYAHDVGNYPLDRIAKAFASYRKNPKNRRCPFPADILALLDPKLSEEDEAASLATKIFDQVRLIGYLNEVRAERELHPAVWDLVKQAGGWKNFCATIPCQVNNQHEANVRSAQLRMAIKAQLIKRASSEVNESDIKAIPHSVSTLISFKKMPK